MLSQAEDPGRKNACKKHIVIRMDWLVLTGAVVFALLAALTVCGFFLPEGPP